MSERRDNDRGILWRNRYGNWDFQGMSSEKKPFLVFEFLASRNPIEKEEDYDFLWSGGRSDATSVLVELTIK